MNEAASLRLLGVTIAVAGKAVVHDIDIEFAKGELTVLLGANGSGKSTLLNGLFGHPDYALTSGEIVLDGEDITSLKTEEKARKGLFLSMQQLPEIPGVTLTNLLYRARIELFGKDTETPVEFHQRMVVLAEQFELKKELLLGEVNRGISGGERKQSELLQILALSPRYVFLDEIDAGMDIDMQRKLRHIIQHLLGRGVGIILISHHIGAVKDLAPHRVLVMESGHIVERGDLSLVHEIEKNGFSGISKNAYE